MWAGLLGCALSVIGVAGTARAQSAPSLVVIITPDPSAPAGRRLARDLEGLGLDVLVLKATPENSSGRASLEKSARSVGAIAAVRLIPSGQGTEVWVADRITGKTLIRELVGSTGSEAQPDDVALGAVELLRASLMELHSPSSPRGEAELTPEVRDLSFATPKPPADKRASPAFSLSAGAGAELGLRSIGPSLHGTWAGWMNFGAGFGARVFLSLPLLAEHASVSEGQVELASKIFGIEGTFELGPADGMLVPRFGLGGALARIETVGRATAPAVSTSAAAWFGGGYGEIGAGLRLSRNLRMRLDATVIVLASAPTVEVNQRSVGRWGAPAGLVSLGLEVLWQR